MNIGEAKAGIRRRVLYTPGGLKHAHHTDGHLRQEKGVIMSVNRKYVFVLYDGGEWAKATDPGTLEFLPEEL